MLQHINQLIYIADDHVLVAEGLSSLLQELGYENIRIFESGRDLYKAFLSEKPNLIFLDIYMTDWDGLTTLREIRKQDFTLPCIIISMMGEKKVVENCIREKANAFLHKSCTVDELQQAIMATQNGNTYVSEKILQFHKAKKQKNVSTYELLEPLSEREKEVLEKLCDGLGFDEIAKALFISQSTVETHKKHLLQKYGVNSVSKMIALAFKHNMI